MLHGNRVQFGQLMQNLIGNAIKYRGPEAPVVEVRCETHDSEHVITVADNGVGIAPQFQERIFGLFKRAHGKNYPGAGVGLGAMQENRGEARRPDLGGVESGTRVRVPVHGSAGLI